MIKIQWLASIWRQNDQNVELRCKTFKTKLNYKSDKNPMTCIDLTSKRSKCWATSQNIQNKPKLQKWSKSNDLHRLDVQKIKLNRCILQKSSKSNDLHRFDVKTIKTFKRKLNYKSDQNPMTCIDLTSKRSKCWVTSQNIQKKAKLQKWSKSNDLHRLDVQKIKTEVYYKSHQNPTTCIDLTSKRSKCWVTSQNIQNKAKLQKWSKSNDLHRFDVKTIKMLSYVAKHSKQSKTTKVIKIQWLASIWRQSDQNVELRRKTFKTKLNYKSDQNPMTCIDMTSKRSKCWVTSQNIQNKAKLQKWSKSNDLHRFDVKTIKMLSYVAKHSKQSETTKVIQIQWLASIGCQNDQNKAKLQKWSKSNDLHRFDVKTIKTIQNKAKLQKWSKSNDLHRFDVKTIKTFKTKLNYKSDQNPMTCIDLTSKRSKCWVTSQNIQNKAKLQKWSKSNDLHRFDVKTIKMLSYVAKHSKQS